jgi:electron transfer flavoprotein alpha subunit
MTPPSIATSGEQIWVVSFAPDDDVVGRLGDARDVADRCDGRVGALRFDSAGVVDDQLAQSWIHHGADAVHILRLSDDGQAGWLDGAQEFWRTRPPRLVISPADRAGRGWSARLAARLGWQLVSPALLVQARKGRLAATRLDGSSRRAQQIELAGDRPAIVTLRPGVAQPRPPETSHRGTIARHAFEAPSRTRIMSQTRVPPDPGRADIRHLPKLISGGRGVGSREGFELLQRIADKLGAGVAASRAAVDLGWIESERQVGQTGKTVRPELYLACGISGASHHWDGMSDSRHIVAINIDPEAPLMQRAELSLQADLHAVLYELNRLLESTT